MSSTSAPQTATVIYHNPRCSTSRNALALLRAGGEAPVVVDYQADLPDRAALSRLIRDAGLTIREALRRKDRLYADLGLDDPSLTDDQLLDSIAAHPILLERPFVVTARGTRLARPLEALFEIMASPPDSFTKENGQIVTRPGA